MKIEKIRIKNFRHIDDLTLKVGDMLALIGPNNVGKSSVLKAIQVFCEPKNSIPTTDFNEANGFQTNYWPGEDTELCLTITKKLGKKIIYDPLVHAYHHRRSFWNGHFKQVTQYALHRGFFVKKFPETSRKFFYFMPTILTIGIFIGWTTFFWCKPLFYVYLAVMTVYFMVLAAASLLASPKLILHTIMGTILTHIAYGIYFIIGLVSSKLKKEEEYHEKLKKMQLM